MRTIMDVKGITLIELVVSVSIVSILAVAMGFQFIGWMKTYRVESEIKQIYSDLINARLISMQRNTCQFIVFTTGNYQAFEDSNGDCQYNAGTDTAAKGFTTAKKLTEPLVAVVGPVIMNTRGLVSPSATIRVDSGSSVSADYDCILLGQTRIGMGKWKAATGVCDAK